MSSNTPEESFRDSIATIDKKGKRAFIYPKIPVGRFYNKRKLLSYGFVSFFIERTIYQNQRKSISFI